jgi:hypothetical protein
MRGDVIMSLFSGLRGKKSGSGGILDNKRIKKTANNVKNEFKKMGHDMDIYQCPNKCLRDGSVYVQAEVKGKPAPNCPTCGALMSCL